MQVWLATNAELRDSANFILYAIVMRALASILTLFAVVGVCFALPAAHASDELSWETAEPEPFVLYGRDDRREVSDSRISGLQNSAAATVALIDNANLSKQIHTVQIRAESARVVFELCPTEKFRKQTAAAFCSGVLVGSDLILTAGHCMPDMGVCNDTSFVFDYRTDNSLGRSNIVPTSSVYRCKAILHSDDSSRGEFALIRLDRDVTGRKPVSIRATTAPLKSTKLVLLGHPMGTPLKVSGPSRILRIDSESFMTNTDSYTGNSGSPVFNLRTKVLEGILSHGQDDFAWKGSCRASRVCENGRCSGELATDASRFAPVVERYLR